MVTTIHPVDATTGAPSYSGRMLRQVGSVAYAGATAARPFGATSGVRPGTSPTTVTATSTTWTVNPHAGLLDLEAAMESGPTPYSIDAAVTGAVTAAAASARIDIVWVRQDIPLEDGTAAPAVVPGYTAGAAGSGTPPATPARCMVLAWVNVPASGGGSPTVTWKATYTNGDLGWITPALGNSWVFMGSIYGTAMYRKSPDGFVTLRGMIKSGTIGLAMFTLPAGYRPPLTEVFRTAAASGVAGMVVDANGDVSVTQYLAGGTNGYVSLSGISFSVTP